MLALPLPPHARRCSAIGDTVPKPEGKDEGESHTHFRTLHSFSDITGRTTSIPWSKTRAGGKKSGALYSAPLFPIACAALFCSADEMSASADNGLSHCGQRKSVTVPQIGISVPLFVGNRRRFQGGRLPAGAQSRAALPSRLPQNCARFCPLPSTSERGHPVALRATPRSNPPIASDGAKQRQSASAPSDLSPSHGILAFTPLPSSAKAVMVSSPFCKALKLPPPSMSTMPGSLNCQVNC